MKKRIKQLIDGAIGGRVERSASHADEITPESLSEIMQEIQLGKLWTYEDIAQQVGCSTETIRLLARPYPILRHAKKHRVPDSSRRLIIRDMLTAKLPARAERRKSVRREDTLYPTLPDTGDLSEFLFAAA